MKTSICLFLVSVFFSNNCLCQQLKADSLRKLMQGEWQSLQDSSYRIDFSGSLVKEYNKGVKGAYICHYTIGRKPCDPLLSSTLGTGYFLVKIDKDTSILCYAITDISIDYLELVYAGGRVLSFKKVHKDGVISDVSR